MPPTAAPATPIHALPVRDGVPGEEDHAIQFVAFKVNGEDFAVDIMAVREIRAWTEISSLPNMPASVRGVLNLRGNIVPIFDLRCRFGQGVTEATRMHVVIILTARERTVGILVDAVSDILKTRHSALRTLPDSDRGEEASYITGLLTLERRMIALLDPDRLFDHSLAAVAQAAA